MRMRKFVYLIEKFKILHSLQSSGVEKASDMNMVQWNQLDSWGKTFQIDEASVWHLLINSTDNSYLLRPLHSGYSLMNINYILDENWQLILITKIFNHDNNPGKITSFSWFWKGKVLKHERISFQVWLNVHLTMKGLPCILFSFKKTFLL